MKKETIGILFVCLILVVGGMFALWITTAPAEGDGWVFIEPIIEDATTTITIDHMGTNATVIPTWVWDWDLESPNHLFVKNKSVLLDNFDTVFTVAYWTDFYDREVDYDARQIKSYAYDQVRIFVLATDGPLTIITQETLFSVQVPDVNHYFHWDVSQTENTTTYTFHYPKIIGWEDP